MIILHKMGVVRPTVTPESIPPQLAEQLPPEDAYSTKHCSVSCDYLSPDAVSAAKRFIFSLRNSDQWDITVTDADGTTVVVRLDTKEILCP